MQWLSLGTIPIVGRTIGWLRTGNCDYDNIIDMMMSSLLDCSWGTNWGLSGYIMMARGKYNQCGIATDAYYPTL